MGELRDEPTIYEHWPLQVSGSENRQFIEGNIILCYNKMHGLYYECLNALSATVCHRITADQTLSFYFIVGGGSVSVDLIFMIMLGSNIHRYSLPSTFIIMNLQNYTTTLQHTSDRKGFLTASKSIKESEKHIYCKSCCVFYLLLILWSRPLPPPPPPPANYKNCSDILIINVWDPTTNLLFVCIVATSFKFFRNSVP